MTKTQQKIWDMVISSPSHVKAAKKERTLRESFRSAYHLSDEWYRLRDEYRMAESDLYALERKLTEKFTKKMAKEAA